MRFYKRVSSSLRCLRAVSKGLGPVIAPALKTKSIVLLNGIATNSLLSPKAGIRSRFMSMVFQRLSLRMYRPRPFGRSRDLKRLEYSDPVMPSNTIIFIRPNYTCRLSPRPWRVCIWRDRLTEPPVTRKRRVRVFWRESTPINPCAAKSPWF